MNRTTLGVLSLALIVLSTIGIGSTSVEARKPTRSFSDAAITVQQATPQLGDVVTFRYSGVTNDCGKNWGPRCLRIELVCTQLDAPVYAGDANADQQFLLGGGLSQWVNNGGPASCTATLYYYSSYNPVTRVDVAKTTFEATG